MTKSNRTMKARVGIAAAVLAGGAAVGVTAVAASGHGTPASARSAGYSMRAGRPAPASMALGSAMSSLQRGQQGKAMTSVASMASMKGFAQARHHGATVALQRGVAELATRRFLLVKSANGQQHLWFLGGAKVVNATASTAAMTAMTGSARAAKAAMASGSMTPAAAAMTGSASAATAMTAPAARPVTVTVNAGGQTITVTVSSTAATVSAPAGTPAAAASSAAATPAASAAATPAASASAMPGGQMMKSTQSVFAMGNGIKRGDLVLVAGLREHGLLVAKLVLFAAPATTATTPAASPTTAPTAPASTPPATPSAPPSGSAGQFSGTHA